MYNSSETSTRIRQLAKEKSIQMSELQEKCGLSKNTIMQSGKSQEGMKAKNLYAIAELLECSVDYLLGRTDNPNETNISITDNKQTSLTGNNSISVNSAAPNKDTLTEQFMQKFEQLDFDDKVDVMQYVKNKK